MDDVTTLEGWFALHDFRSINWQSWQLVPSEERKVILAELYEIFGKWCSIDKKHEGSFALFEICGHKADFVFLNLRPSLEALTELERAFNRTTFATFCMPKQSYVSVVELSTYVVNHEADPRNDPQVQARLYPSIPERKNICFYPMNKKREGADNWYTQSIEDRRAMMKSHGLIGRKYAGKVVQMIGGSVGLDDYEWGVTLFADDPVTFKKLIYEMRFDEVSARFAEFGQFWVGSATSLDRFAEILG